MTLSSTRGPLDRYRKDTRASSIEPDSSPGALRSSEISVGLAIRGRNRSSGGIAMSASLTPPAQEPTAPIDCPKAEKNAKNVPRSVSSLLFEYDA